ncbi:MAG TPA: serine hydrolase domain-containing protein [Bryobacteraceae bacterium]|nr:serine hydrolase domain-containing protein [Bryobacteraceae bacterium]
MLRSQSLRARFGAIAGVLISLLPAAAGAASLDAERLKLIPARMQEFVDNGSISGAVWLIAYRGQVVALDAAGFAGIEHRKPMRADSIVQIMSQTKSFTGVAAMMLVEEGKLDLTRPVRDYLPEFQGQLVEEKHADGSRSTHLPEHPMTVWQLMSHTSGFDFLPPSGPLSRINFTLNATLADAVHGYAREHLIAEPGTQYHYSNMGIATLGRIVEVLSGQDYAQFVERRILTPLGMTDSFFYPPPDKRGRIAMVYQHENGKLVLSRERAQAGDPALYRAGAKYPGPELGLYSTATDLFHFYQMLANGGTYNGRRYLSPQSVAAMTEDHTPEHSGYGLTLSVAGKPGALLHLLSPGTFGHGGAFGTDGLVDPAHGLVMIFLPQMNDGTAGPAGHAVVQIAESAVE